MISDERSKYKSWSNLKKQMNDLLCNSLKDKISYFYTNYHEVHNAYGRATINYCNKEAVSIFRIFFQRKRTMRYFKCDIPNTTENDALRVQYVKFTEQEKKQICKQKGWNTFGTVLFFAVSIVCFVCCVLALVRIPLPENIFFAILYGFGIFLLGFVALIVSFLIGALVSTPFWSKVDKSYKLAKRELLSQACMQLQEYYGLQEPCIVTKCYESSDKKFKNHDICLFLAENELRITTNLQHGFFHCKHDLGCYAFKADEISLKEIQREEISMTELKVEDTVFLLGRRAKGFIEKNFITKECDI